MRIRHWQDRTWEIIADDESWSVTASEFAGSRLAVEPAGGSIELTEESIAALKSALGAARVFVDNFEAGDELMLLSGLDIEEVGRGS